MEQKAKSCYRCGREGHIVRCLHPRFAFSCHPPHCDAPSGCNLGESYSRVIVLNLKAQAVLEGPVVVAAVAVVVLARNAIAVVRSDTLHVRAPRHPEAAQEEATVGVGVGEEATVVLGAVKKHGALSLASREWY
jgi:hypothetical protein